MMACWRSVLAALLGTALAACAQLGPPVNLPQSAGDQPGLPRAKPAVAVREDLSPRFIALTGPKRQHAPPFLDVAGTNFYCLRSFIERETGATEHQLYVSDSYVGVERQWNAAYDGSGGPLRFISVSRAEISCMAGCSYLEEFAATIPESALRANAAGFEVTFIAGSGDEKTILVSGDQIAAQLAAVGSRRSSVQPTAVLAAPPPE
jgi:hypothetical protein